jgi:hypothetical protein
MVFPKNNLVQEQEWVKKKISGLSLNKLKACILAQIGTLNFSYQRNTRYDTFFCQFVATGV